RTKILMRAIRWRRGDCGQGLATDTGARTTFRSATSCWAVIAIFAERTTRGAQPRDSWAARSPANTANSNALMPIGRLIMEASVASATLARTKALVRALAGMAEGSKKRDSQYTAAPCYAEAWFSDSCASDLRIRSELLVSPASSSPSILPGPAIREICIHAMQE